MTKKLTGSILSIITFCISSSLESHADERNIVDTVKMYEEITRLNREMEALKKKSVRVKTDSIHLFHEGSYQCYLTETKGDFDSRCKVPYQKTHPGRTVDWLGVCKLKFTIPIENFEVPPTILSSIRTIKILTANTAKAKGEGNTVGYSVDATSISNSTIEMIFSSHGTGGKCDIVDARIDWIAVGSPSL